jgi:hypothetical protein
VTVEAGGVRQSRWVRSGSSYCSSSEAAALFGLGETRTVDRILVRWSSGSEQEIRHVAADREIVVREQ